MVTLRILDYFVRFLIWGFLLENNERKCKYLFKQKEYDIGMNFFVF